MNNKNSLTKTYLKNFKFSNFGLKTGFYIFAVAYLMNFLAHVLGHYLPLVTREVDFLLYASEIAAFFIAYKIISLPKVKELNRVTKALKGIIIAESILCFIFTTDGCLAILLFLCFPAKIILELYFYIALINSSDALVKNFGEYLHAGVIDRTKKYKVIWIAYHIVLVALYITAVKLDNAFLCYLWLLLFASRIYLIYRIINLTDAAICNVGPRFADTKKRKKSLTIPPLFKTRTAKFIYITCIALLSLGCLILKNKYTGDLYLVDAKGNIVSEQKAIAFFSVDDKEEVYQYKVRSILPTWLGGSDSKYGLINIKTGENTGPIYDEILDFDWDLTAWDGKGHIIDTAGNVLLTIPKSITKKRAIHQEIYDELLAGIIPGDLYDRYYDFYDAYREGPFIKGGSYFYNGTSVYFNELSGKYGLIDDNGNILTDTEYDCIIFDPYSGYYPRCFTAHKFQINGVYEYVINNRGEIILVEDPDKKIWIHKIDYEIGYIRYSESCDNHNSDKYLNYDGIIISDEYELNPGISLTGCENDVLNAKSLDENDTKAYAIGTGGKVLFGSDKYTEYYSYRANRQGINYLVALNNSGNYELINLNGEQIIPGEFTNVMQSRADSPLVFSRASNDSDYPTELYIYSDGEYMVHFLSLGNDKNTDFGYDTYYDLDQDSYVDYYWRLNLGGMYEIYSLDGELIDTTTSVKLFDSEHQRPEKEEGPKYPEAVTSKYGYVEYGGHTHYAVTNDRPSNLDN